MSERLARECIQLQQGSAYWSSEAMRGYSNMPRMQWLRTSVLGWQEQAATFAYEERRLRGVE